MVVSQKKGPSLTVYLEKRIVDFKDQKVLHRGYPYSGSAISSWEKFLRLWKDFCSESGPEPPLSSLTGETFNQFLNYCDRRNYRESTRSLMATLFKAAVNAAVSDGLASEKQAHQFETPSRTITDAKKVYLTRKEIQLLENLSLPPGGGLDKARDIFLVGCYTGQRFSDYCRLSLDDLILVPSDNQNHYAFRKKQQKTGAEVYIPIIYKEVLSILSRWGGTLPGISPSLFNREIKKICRMAGIDEPVKIVERVGGREISRQVPKYALVSSHTARRSFITNMYLEGQLSEMQLRSISGHRTSASFQRYICCSGQDNLRGIFETLNAREVPVRSYNNNIPFQDMRNGDTGKGDGVEKGKVPT